MRAFEEQLNRKLKRGRLRVHVVMIPTPSDRLLTDLLAGRGDIAVGTITITQQRRELVEFTTPVARNIKEIIVTSPQAPPLAILDDLSGKEIFVRRTSSHFEHLVALNRTFAARGLPPAKIRIAPSVLETEDILEMLNAGLVQITAADDYLARLWRSVYTNIELHDNLILSDGGEIAFAFRKHSPKLSAELNAFVRTHKQGTTFGNVTLRKYLQQTRWVKNATSPSQLRRFNTLVELFRKYGERYRIDWILLAALGYQESQLDHRKRSPAGAVGVMQIMPDTGKLMRVGNIEQLEPNIHAGVKYTRYIIDEYFADPNIDEFNRTLLALASYNAGPDRIATLRKEAAQKGLDPNVWFDNVERIVAQRVGRETVQYVGNIYKYYVAYSLVQQHEPELAESRQF
jgi:membrane-bound lytic murein transglycosylase MltF